MCHLTPPIMLHTVFCLFYNCVHWLFCRQGVHHDKLVLVNFTQYSVNIPHTRAHTHTHTHTHTHKSYLGCLTQHCSNCCRVFQYFVPFPVLSLHFLSLLPPIVNTIKTSQTKTHISMLMRSCDINQCCLIMLCNAHLCNNVHKCKKTQT